MNQVYRRRFYRKGKFDPTFNGAVAVCDVAPAAQAQYRLTMNGAFIATVTFPAGSKNGSFLLTTNAVLSFNVGASFGIVSPSVQDADMSGLDISVTYLLT